MRMNRFEEKISRYQTLVIGLIFALPIVVFLSLEEIEAIRFLRNLFGIRPDQPFSALAIFTITSLYFLGGMISRLITRKAWGLILIWLLISAGMFAIYVVLGFIAGMTL